MGQSQSKSRKPRPGDLIEIFRGAYQHWALYTGNDFVIHLAPPSEVPDAGLESIMSVLTDTALVKKEKLWEVVGDCDWKVNNILDKEYDPHPVHEIVKEAHSMVGQEVPYSIYSSNCEHFVTELRYGKAESRQVHRVEEAMESFGYVGTFMRFIGMMLGRLFGGGGKEKEEDDE